MQSITDVQIIVPPFPPSSLVTMPDSEQEIYRLIQARKVAQTTVMVMTFVHVADERVVVLTRTAWPDAVSQQHETWNYTSDTGWYCCEALLLEEGEDNARY